MSVAPIGWVAGRLYAAAGWLTGPRSPDDYLRWVDPMLSTRHPAGRVVAVRAETAEATTLTIRTGRGWSGHRPGQYVPVGVEVDGVRVWRTYSLTSLPGRADGCVEITVKARPGGCVSPLLAHRTLPGQVLRLGPAQGEFTLPTLLPQRLLMLTAGTGITPAMGLLRALAHRPHAGLDVLLLHSVPGADDCLFRDELRSMASRLPWLRLHEHHTRGHSGPTGRLTLRQMAELCPDWPERETYACGPESMLDGIQRHWARAGVARRLHVERFVRTVRALPRTPRVGGPVRFVRSGVEAEADDSAPLLEVGESAGVLLPYGCRQGICHGCVAALTYGHARDLRTGEIHTEPGRLIQTCVSAAAGPLGLDI
ncbi:ferredoxin reductase [Streptomycetaceae bacterium NBC_01309]